MAEIRLQKFLADQGVASRRKAEAMIEEGRVTVNGEVVTRMGVRIDPDLDDVEVDRRPIAPDPIEQRTIIMYKPRGYVCSTEGQSSKTVYELLPDVPRALVPVGRLDKSSEGLLLMSNDGELVHSLTHPRYEHSKVYHVTVSGRVTPNVLETLNGRMMIDDHQIRPCKVSVLREGEKRGRKILQFVLKEGRNRQIRKMCEQVSLTVHRLVRHQISGLVVGKLKPGEWRDLRKAEIRKLLD